MFGGDKHCGNRDMFLICHVISRDHVVQESCDSIDKSPVKFDSHRKCGCGDIMILVSKRM